MKQTKTRMIKFRVTPAEEAQLRALAHPLTMSEWLRKVALGIDRADGRTQTIRRSLAIIEAELADLKEKVGGTSPPEGDSIHRDRDQGST